MKVYLFHKSVLRQDMKDLTSCPPSFHHLWEPHGQLWAARNLLLSCLRTKSSPQGVHLSSSRKKTRWGESGAAIDIQRLYKSAPHKSAQQGTPRALALAPCSAASAASFTQSLLPTPAILPHISLSPFSLLFLPPPVQVPMNNFRSLPILEIKFSGQILGREGNGKCTQRGSEDKSLTACCQHLPHRPLMLDPISSSEFEAT